MTTHKAISKSFISTVAHILTTFTQKNEASSACSKGVRLASCRGILKFTSQKVPSVSVYKYLKRIAKLTFFAPELFICSLVYLDRLIQTQHTCISILELHRLWFTAYLLATKVHCDRFYDNEYYSYVAGISTEELNELEREFVHLVDYHLFVSYSTYKLYKAHVYKYQSAFILPLKRAPVRPRV